MADIQDRAGVEQLVDTFYKKVLIDPEIGYLFTEIVPLDWDKHIPKMYDFWESILFDSQNYRGNPMQVHLDLHQQEKLKSAHFERWLELFSETLDELFEGEKTELAKVRAQSIATVIQSKIYQYDQSLKT